MVVILVFYFHEIPNRSSEHLQNGYSSLYQDKVLILIHKVRGKYKKEVDSQKKGRKYGYVIEKLGEKLGSFKNQIIDLFLIVRQAPVHNHITNKKTYQTKYTEEWPDSLKNRNQSKIISYLEHNEWKVNKCFEEVAFQLVFCVLTSLFEALNYSVNQNRHRNYVLKIKILVAVVFKISSAKYKYRVACSEGYIPQRNNKWKKLVRRKRSNKITY